MKKEDVIFFDYFTFFFAFILKKRRKRSILKSFLSLHVNLLVLEDTKGGS